MCIGRNNKDMRGKNLRDKKIKKKVENNYLKNPIKLGEETYSILI
jgi:hypothetical protein